MPADQQEQGQPIAAGDVNLRPLSAADAAALAAGDFRRIQPGEGWPHEDSLDGLRMAAGGYGVAWLITLGDLVVGECGTHGSPDQDGVVEIGYGLAAPYRGRGHGGRTVRALAHWLLRQPGITAVLAHTDPQNVPSRRSLESAGFVLEGTFRGECRYRLS